jgi:DNA-binding NtrC family response regulator
MNELKIFIVEDDKVYLSLFEKYLQSIGYDDVVAFESGLECLNNLEQRPDVIFLDFYMDIINGGEVLNKIKRFDPNIFVVMLSGQNDIRTAVNFLKSGGFDYLVKGEDDMKRVEEVLRSVQDVKIQIEQSKPSVFQRIFKKK